MSISTFSTARRARPSAPISPAPERCPNPAIMRAMARTEDGGARSLIQLKAVDGAYPLYGSVTLDPPLSLDDALGIARRALGRGGGGGAVSETRPQARRSDPHRRGRVPAARDTGARARRVERHLRSGPQGDAGLARAGLDRPHSARRAGGLRLSREAAGGQRRRPLRRPRQGRSARRRLAHPRLRRRRAQPATPARPADRVPDPGRADRAPGRRRRHRQRGAAPI